MIQFFPLADLLTYLNQTASENIVSKEEIAHYEQFLLFTMFTKLSVADYSLLYSGKG